MPCTMWCTENRLRCSVYFDINKIEIVISYYIMYMCTIYICYMSYVNFLGISVHSPYIFVPIMT